ncbi:MAG: hypothetical protein JXA18_05875 [Chitinispirillaceae bacterium]|nr:hypothetical protein [Chitinispirillaceae bacterium]
MGKSPRLEDVMMTDGLPMPWNNLQHSLEIGEDYTVGAKKIAAFLVNVEEAIPLDELFDMLFASTPPREWFEFMIVCMLDTGYSDSEVARNVLRLHCMRRLFMRIKAGVTVDRQEEELYRKVLSFAEVRNIPEFLGLTFFTRELVEIIIRQGRIGESHRRLLVGLIRLEAQALKIRIDRLSDSIDAYSMKEMGRMLPIIKRLDENLLETEHLADSIERNVDLGRASMTLAGALKAGSFEKWVDKMGKGGEVRALKEALLLQHLKCAPTRSVVALLSLYRWVFEANGISVSPGVWAERALELYDNGRFKIDLGNVIDQLRDHLQNAGAWIEGTIASGSFSDRLYSQWIGTNGLSRPLDRKEETEEREKQLTVRQLVYRFVGNESVMYRLLDNPEIFGAPGIVEYIAKNSRSVMVLSKIASNNHLYAGPNNDGVPKALLTNPSSIPLSLLRIFFKPSFFSTAELRRLVDAYSSMRPEVIAEIREYVEDEEE